MSEWLFHVTYAANLTQIGHRGLRAGGESPFGPSYASNIAGRIFFTVDDGIHFWYDKLETAADTLSDNTWEDQLIPVVLGVSRDAVGQLELDAVGTQDAKADAFYTTNSVSPELLEIWDGEDWVPLLGASIDLELAVTPSEECDGGECWTELEWNDPNPLREIE